MDSLITAAGLALAAGDPLGALDRVALREDAPALALRGIAMAQLGDLNRAKALLQRAARAFGPKEAVARARCVVAEAEIALVSRDLGFPAKALDAARISYQEIAAELCDLPNKPGALANCLNQLAKKGVNLSTIHATAAKGGKKAVVVYTSEAATAAAAATA